MTITIEELLSLLTPILPSYMVAPKSSIANTHNSKKLMSPNFKNTKARPDNTTLSIQKGRPLSQASTESSHSSSPSLMDDSPPSDYDYAKRVAAQNNMDIMADNAPPSNDPQKYNFAMLPSQMPHAPHKDVPNEPSPADNFNIVRATGHKAPGESSVNITVCNYDTTHLQENPQRLG